LHHDPKREVVGEQAGTLPSIMSGRLTILPKKTYCPWKPENVERVLRDERLERERQQAATSQSLGDVDDARRRRRRYDDGGHLNLFPEAKDAELRVISGGRVNEHKSKSSSSSSSTAAVEVLPPAPLGGDEAAKRKSGDVPFYMRQSSELRGKYDNTHGSSFRLGDNRSTGIRGDEITGKIMKDQFARREDDRKDKMDPMSRFYVDRPNPSLTTGVSANSSDRPTRESYYGVAHNRTVIVDDQLEVMSRDERKVRHKKPHRSEHRRRDASSDESLTSGSSSTSTSSPNHADNSRNRRERTSGRHRKRHKSRSYREGSSSRPESERDDRRSRSSKRSRNHRYRHRHSSSQGKK